MSVEAGIPQVRTRKTALALDAIRIHARLTPGLATLWFVTLVGAVTLPLISTLLLGELVGAVPDGVGATTGPLVGLVIVELLLLPCASLGWVLCWSMGRHYRLAHRERIMHALLDPAGVAHMHAPGTLDAAHAADNAWVDNMLEGVNNVAIARLTGAGALLIVARDQPLAAAILAVAWLVMGSWRWRRVRTTSNVVSGQAQPLRRAQAMSDLALTPAAAKEVRLFGWTSFVTTRYASEWFTAMGEVWRERRAAAKGAFAVAALLFGGHVVALALIADAAVDGRIELGALAAILQSIVMARELGEGVMGQWEVDYGLPLIDRVKVLEHTVHDRGERIDGREVAPVPKNAIRFEHVGFRYPGGARDVLRDVDLELDVGTSLAIVGENGAGKTTTVQLLSRLRDPTMGRITVDGVDLRSVDPQAWHDLVAAVSQDALRMPLSVTDNVGGGRTSDVAILEQAAADAGILEVIRGMPRGWETVLAKGFTDGADLSGGQWQRLALARGLVALATGAELLVLDEPTAHLDVRAEAMLYNRFLELTRGRTTVLVSHRFSTVRRADRIAVIADGRVVEHGSHDELVSLGGRYAQMFALQSAPFT